MLPLSDSARRHVRKTHEAGFTTTAEWDFDDFWRPFASTSRRQGFAITLGADALRTVAERMHDAGMAWMIRVQNRQGSCVASQIVLGERETASAYMWLAGTEDDALASGASTRLMVSTAEEALRRGHREWDLCGADLPGVARFKGELGGELRTYFQVDAPRHPAARLMGWARGLVRRSGRNPAGSDR